MLRILLFLKLFFVEGLPVNKYNVVDWTESSSFFDEVHEVGECVVVLATIYDPAKIYIYRAYK